MKSIVHFITYNNAVPIALAVLLLGAGGALAASPSVRESIYAEQEVLRAVDNTKLVATDISNYNFSVRLNSITEDDATYYIEYSFTTLAVSDDVWREVPQIMKMKVSKKAIQGRDLGLYITEQIGQVIDQETAYLKEVQLAEKTKGVTPKVVVVEYSGIVGKMLDPKERTFPGYVPVVSESSPEPTIDQAADVAAVASAAPSTTESEMPTVSAPVVPTPEDIRAIVDTAIREYLANAASQSAPQPSAPSSPDPVSPVPEPLPAPEPSLEPEATDSAPAEPIPSPETTSVETQGG